MTERGGPVDERAAEVSGLAARASLAGSAPAPPAAQRADSIREATYALEYLSDAVQGLWDELDAARSALAHAEQERDQALRERDQAQSQADAVADALAEARSDVQSAHETARVLREQVEALNEEIQLARLAAAPRPSAPQRAAQAPPAPPPPRQPAPPQQAAPQPPPATAADGFLDWCHRGGGLVNRVEHFERALAAALPGASVRAVYRDSDSPARPVRLTTSPGVSPVQYWAITHDGALTVVPQPVNPSQFRELAPCFEGRRVPVGAAPARPPRRPRGRRGRVRRHPGPGRVARRRA